MTDQNQHNQNFDNQNPIDETRDQVQQAAESAGQAARETQAQVQAAVDRGEGAVQRTIGNVKSSLPNPAPEPPNFKRQSTAFDVKSRLQWGEPGLTIIDVRERDAFNDQRIMGAIAAPTLEGTTPEQISGLEANRDIYIYGASDEESRQAAQDMRSAGFSKVAIIEGGLEAWKEIDGPTEGRVSLYEQPGQSEFNVVSRWQEHSEVREREAAQASS